MKLITAFLCVICFGQRCAGSRDYERKEWTSNAKLGEYSVLVATVVFAAAVVAAAAVGIKLKGLVGAGDVISTEDWMDIENGIEVRKQKLEQLTNKEQLAVKCVEKPFGEAVAVKLSKELSSEAVAVELKELSSEAVTDELSKELSSEAVVIELKELSSEAVAVELSKELLSEASGATFTRPESNPSIPEALDKGDDVEKQELKQLVKEQPVVNIAEKPSAESVVVALACVLALALGFVLAFVLALANFVLATILALALALVIAVSSVLATLCSSFEQQLKSRLSRTSR